MIRAKRDYAQRRMDEGEARRLNRTLGRSRRTIYGTSDGEISSPTHPHQDRTGGHFLKKHSTYGPTYLTAGYKMHHLWTDASTDGGPNGEPMVGSRGLRPETRSLGMDGNTIKSTRRQHRPHQYQGMGFKRKARSAVEQNKLRRACRLARVLREEGCCLSHEETLTSDIAMREGSLECSSGNTACDMNQFVARSRVCMEEPRKVATLPAPRTWSRCCP